MFRSVRKAVGFNRPFGSGVVVPGRGIGIGLPLPIVGVTFGEQTAAEKVKALLKENGLTLSVTDEKDLHNKTMEFAKNLHTITALALMWPVEQLVAVVGTNEWGKEAHKNAYNTAIETASISDDTAKKAYKAMFDTMTKFCGEVKNTAESKGKCRDILSVIIQNKPNIDRFNKSNFVHENFRHHIVTATPFTPLGVAAPFGVGLSLNPFRTGEVGGSRSSAAEPLYDAQIGGFRVNTASAPVLSNMTDNEPIYDPQVGGFRVASSNASNSYQQVQTQTGGADAEPSKNGKMVDMLGFLLDIASLFPGTNLPFIIASMFLNIGEGRNDDALITLMGMLPIINTMISVPTKYFNRVIKEEAGRKVEQIAPVEPVAEPTPIAAAVTNPPVTNYAKLAKLNRF
jgi:hypothetical protein